MTTPTREQILAWPKQAWDDTGEGWTSSRWFDERAPSFEAFATLARADLDTELESLRKLIKNSTEYRLGHPAYEQAAAPAMAHSAMKEK